ncbi:MAG: C4-dicarboxylate ABC transporter substrate-binding protein [Burkholderiaceae bacterium]|nr:MAG: C4-dicarboxylate ABC transporter substrate-binding protein [Burkholderiaceae bacterium]
MAAAKIEFGKSAGKFRELFGQSAALSAVLFALIALALGLAVVMFFQTAAPTHLTLVSGPEGSSSQRSAEKYKAILAREGVKLNVLPSTGSVDNLKQLTDPKSRVDVGFVQGGDLQGINIEYLVSLGSVSYQPLMIFYHGAPKKLLSDFKGDRIDIGPEGSGSHTLALTLLKANGIEPNDASHTQFIDVPDGDSKRALLENRIDGLFMMSDSTAGALMRELLHTPGVQVFNFVQADAYARRFNYLNKLELPRGALDFGKDTPSADVSLIAPTVELIARENLHPALSDVLLEAAKEVHGNAGLFKKRGEFPAPLEQQFRISPDAARYYTSGKSFLYRYFPYWIASLISRTLAIIVPIILVLVPALKFVPMLYRWRMQSRIYRWYRALLDLEHKAFRLEAEGKSLTELLEQLDQIDRSVSKIKVPAAFADLFYDLRGNISFVRSRLAGTPLKGD